MQTHWLEARSVGTAAQGWLVQGWLAQLGALARCLLACLMLMAAPATHGASCSVSAPGLSFNNYDPISANSVSPLDGATTLTIDCRGTLIGLQTINVTISLSSGSGAGAGSYNPRQMQRTGFDDRLNYNLYWDAARTQIAGNNTAGTFTRSDSAQINCAIILLCTGTTFIETIYGRVFGGQDAAVGNYVALPSIIASVDF